MAKEKPPGQWWDKSWTLVEGCVWEPGAMPFACELCWARAMARRWRPDMLEGVKLRTDRLDLPLKHRKPRVWACQINFGDIFQPAVPDEFVAEAVNTMVGECSAEAPPQHVYVWLTKRPELAARFFAALPELEVGPPEDVNFANSEVLRGHPRFYLVPSAWDQASADRAAELVAPLGFRWGLHLEPLLEDVCVANVWGEIRTGERDPRPSWIAVGGENGPGARPMDLDWARSIRDQCRNAGIPFWMKGAGRGHAVPDDLLVREVPW